MVLVKLISSEHPDYAMHLVEVSEGSENIIAHILKAEDQLKLVDLEHQILPIEPNALPANELITLYHMSIQLVLSYHGLSEDNVSINADHSELKSKTMITMSYIIYN